MFFPFQSATPKSQLAKSKISLHLDEVAIGHKGDIPKASSVVVHNLHVVKGTRVVSIRGQAEKEFFKPDQNNQI